MEKAKVIEKLKDLDLLIVEDGDDIRTIMESTFNKICSTRVASNGEEALEQYRSKKPDVIITDIRMPIMNGNQMIDIIKDDDPSIPIIVVSGHGRIIRANQRANVIMEKPIKFDILLSEIYKLVTE